MKLSTTKKPCSCPLIKCCLLNGKFYQTQSKILRISNIKDKAAADQLLNAICMCPDYTYKVHRDHWYSVVVTVCKPPRNSVANLPHLRIWQAFRCVWPSLSRIFLQKGFLSLGDTKGLHSVGHMGGFPHQVNFNKFQGQRNWHKTLLLWSLIRGQQFHCYSFNPSWLIRCPTSFLYGLLVISPLCLVFKTCKFLSEIYILVHLNDSCCQATNLKVCKKNHNSHRWSITNMESHLVSRYCTVLYQLPVATASSTASTAIHHWRT